MVSICTAGGYGRPQKKTHLATDRYMDSVNIFSTGEDHERNKCFTKKCVQLVIGVENRAGGDPASRSSWSAIPTQSTRRLAKVTERNHDHTH